MGQRVASAWPWRRYEIQGAGYVPAHGPGVSEGRLRYVEVFQKEPFILSSFTLDDDGSGWTLEHQVALGRIWPDAGQQEAMPRIAVIDPLKAHTMCVVIGNYAATVDMDLRKVLERVHLGDRGGSRAVFSAFLKPCLLPPWLESSPVPTAGDQFSDAPCLCFTCSAIILLHIF
jgi:hypothetical protein